MGSVVGGLVSGIGGLIGANNTPKNTFVASTPQIEKQDLVSQLNSLTPQQQALTQMLMQQSQGQGPNPAQAMLNQATNKNIETAAGMAASNRGISPALAARLGAQNAARANQEAAGQSAVMNAQQQLAARGQLAQTLGQQQSVLQQAQAAQNAAINQGALGAQGINAGAAAQNAQNAANTFGGAMQGFGSALSGGSMPGGGGGGLGGLAGFVAALGGEVPHYDEGGTVDWLTAMKSSGGSYADLAMAQNPYAQKPSSTQQPKSSFGIKDFSGAPAPDVDITKQNQLSPYGHTAEIDTAGGGLSAFVEPGKMASYNGGQVPYYDEGTTKVQEPEKDEKPLTTGYGENDPRYSGADYKESETSPYNVRQKEAMNAMGSVFHAKGGPVKAMVSPDERYIPPHLVKKALHGNPMKEGVRIPGKAKVPGNSIKNDTVPMFLKPGGVVLPRSVTTAKNPEEKARVFMMELQKNKAKESGSGAKGFNKVLEAQQHLARAHAALKKATG